MRRDRDEATAPLLAARPLPEEASAVDSADARHSRCRRRRWRLAALALGTAASAFIAASMSGALDGRAHVMRASADDPGGGWSADESIAIIEFLEFNQYRLFHHTHSSFILLFLRLVPSSFSFSCRSLLVIGAELLREPCFFLAITA